MKIHEKWMPLIDFLTVTKITKNQMYEFIKSRQWYDGYVIKKSPTGRWMLGSLEDFYKWMGILK